MFKSLWYALAFAPREKVDLTIRRAWEGPDVDRVRSAGWGGDVTFGSATPDVTILLELIDDPAMPGGSEGIVAHEIAHAAGIYVGRGVSLPAIQAVCGNADHDPFAPSLPCVRNFTDQIMGEWKGSH